MQQPLKYNKVKKIIGLPIAELFSKHLPAVLFALCATWMLAASLGTIILFMPTDLHKVLGIPLDFSLTLNLFTFSCLIPVMGYFSDRFGQSNIMPLGCILLAVLTYPIYLIIGSRTLPLQTLAFFGIAFSCACVVGP